MSRTALKALDNAIVAACAHDAPTWLVQRLLAERSAEASRVGEEFFAEPNGSALCELWMDNGNTCNRAETGPKEIESAGDGGSQLAVTAGAAGLQTRGVA